MVERELDMYAARRAEGATGLGPRVAQGNATLASLQSDLARTQTKEATRLRGDVVLENAYRHMVSFTNIAGLQHPPPHPKDPVFMSNLQLTEALLEDYGIKAEDIDNLDAMYPLTMPSTPPSTPPPVGPSTPITSPDVD